MPSGNIVYISIELSVSSWLVAARLPDTEKSRLYRLEGGDTVLSSLAPGWSNLSGRAWRTIWLPVEDREDAVHGM